ncbi:sodium:solute symporter [Aliifodinibius sp. S!AR15-10]|uniref:sodium:solute symporter n=1 Tax=Aliifodinibius sp. S!AR15-10 TaxID=2950437 RepID=UPI0028557303|nr:sodium:solute symporter [Aliifodinibius sp. S!AR15-10]MDR8393066.1 sodium:solute symporter [Aliifodinibius sp. S!AR15-10]
MEFSVIDYIVIVLYLVGVAVIGIRIAGKQTSTSDYFLGGHGIPWWAVLFSVVATETSTLTFISIPAVAYGGDLTFLQITLGYIVGRILVSLFFLPKYYEGNLTTAYQFLANRFGPSMRNAASTTFMITRLLADGVRLFATAIPLAIILRLGGAFSGWGDLEVYLLSITAISAITLIYTLIGGIKAVVWMDVMQMAVYIGGALLAMGIMINGLPNGAWGAVSTALEAGKLNLVDFGFDMNFSDFIAAPYTFFTALIGGAIFSVASHGTDQLIVQRLLTTQNLKNSQRALVWSGFVVALQFALFLVIGLLLYAFYNAQPAEALGLATTDEIFAKFIVEQLPVGLSGLIVAALFAAAMSSLSSSLNSLASSTTLDLYKPYFGKENTEAEDLRISRIITIGWAIILTGSAFFFAILQLQEGERPAVVELGLGIASYTYGGLLGAFVLGRWFDSPDLTDALIGFFAGLISLLFMVEGPIQNLLPGEALAIAWPLYTVVGSLIVVVVGNLSWWTRRAS